MSREILVSTSMLSADFARLAEEAAALREAGADWLHWDCMDGVFTKRLTHGPLVLKALRPHSDLYFDTHLMFHNPGPHIEQFAQAGADGISIHAEAQGDIAQMLGDIRTLGCKSCLTVNPATSVDTIEALLPLCDVVMVMGVVPGAAGQAYMEGTDERIARIRAMIDRAGLPTLLEVDGGVNDETVSRAVGSGADVLVSASYVFKHPEGYAAAIRRLREIARCDG